MINQMKFVLAAAAASSALVLSSVGAVAMPAASTSIMAPSAAEFGVEKTHAVWVCRNGRCWWSNRHRHGGGGWGGGHYGWGWGGHHGGGHHGHHGGGHHGGGHHGGSRHR